MSKDDMMRLSIETGASMRTVARWAKRLPVSKISDYALTAAARKLRIRRPRT